MAIKVNTMVDYLIPHVPILTKLIEVLNTLGVTNDNITVYDD